MTAELIVRGDQLPVLIPLAVAQASGSASPTAMVWGVDLAGEPSRRLAQKRFRRMCAEVGEFAASHPRLDHLFIVYTHGGALPEGTCLSTAGHAATRLHATIERSRGRSLDVIALDVTGWEDGELIRDRIIDAAETPTGTAADIALGWHDITEDSIRVAAAKQYY
jgi:hypothetical protein